MLVLTVQKESVVQMIKSGMYYPNFWLSEFSCMTTRFTEAYKYLRDALSKKIGKSYLESDFCMWGWVANPFVLFHTVQVDWQNMVALFLDIPEDGVVFSDYDMFTSYVWGESNDGSFVIEDFPEAMQEVDKRCVQCVFDTIRPSDIVYEVNLGSLLEGREVDKAYTVNDLYIKGILVEEFKRLKQLSKA